MPPQGGPLTLEGRSLTPEASRRRVANTWSSVEGNWIGEYPGSNTTRSITRTLFKITLQGLEGSVPKVSMGSSSFSSYFIEKDIQESLNGFCLLNALQSCSCGSLLERIFGRSKTFKYAWRVLLNYLCSKVVGQRISYYIEGQVLVP